MTLMKTTTSWVVVTVNGASRPTTFRRAQAMCKALTTGMRGGRKLPGGPIAAAILTEEAWKARGNGKAA